MHSKQEELLVDGVSSADEIFVDPANQGFNFGG